PQYWSQYNIWVATTPKGTKYFNEILAPKFYNKYKDLEVEIDDISVLAPLYKLQYTIISVAIIALIAILTVVYFFIRKIIGSRIPL
ncbi:hypothetical protein VWM83_09345, partial [Campylobacter coli]